MAYLPLVINFNYQTFSWVRSVITREWKLSWPKQCHTRQLNNAPPLQIESTAESPNCLRHYTSLGTSRIFTLCRQSYPILNFRLIWVWNRRSCYVKVIALLHSHNAAVDGLSWPQISICHYERKTMICVLALLCKFPVTSPPTRCAWPYHTQWSRNVWHKRDFELSVLVNGGLWALDEVDAEFDAYSRGLVSGFRLYWELPCVNIIRWVSVKKEWLHVRLQSQSINPYT